MKPDIAAKHEISSTGASSDSEPTESDLRKDTRKSRILRGSLANIWYSISFRDKYFGKHAGESCLLD